MSLFSSPFSRKQSYIGSKITPIYKCKLQGGNYAFFQAATLGSTLDLGHSWYGNVKCIISMQDFLRLEGMRMYFVDTCVFINCATTRILITKKRQEKHTFIDHNKTKIGDVFYVKNGKFVYAKTYTHTCGKEMRHLIHFILDCDSIDMRELFQQSWKLGIDHSMANTTEGSGKYKSSICLIYNGEHKPCVSPYTAEQVQKKLLKDEKITLDSAEDVTRAIKG